MHTKSKEFTVSVNGREHRLSFKRPNQDELFKLDKQYRIIYAEALRSGLMTEAEARKRFKTNGAWTKDDENKIQELSMDIAKRVRTLETKGGMTRDEKLGIIDSIATLRTELIQHIGLRTTMFSQTAEGLSSEQRMHKFVELCCIDNHENNPFFSGYEDYVKFSEKYPDELSEILKQSYIYEYSIDENEDYPEVKVLRQIMEDQIEEAKDQEVDEPPVLENTT